MKTKNKRLALIQENLNNPDTINDYINMDSTDIKSHYDYYIVGYTFQRPTIGKKARLNRRKSNAQYQEILNINLGGDTE